MTVSTATTIIVGLGEVKISEDPETVLACLGLGSCIAISVFDPVAKIGGMAHVVLPASHGKTGDKATRYANVAVPKLFELLRKHGAVNSRLVINLAGGAQMSLAPGMGTAFKIGEENTAAVLAALAAEGLGVCPAFHSRRRKAPLASRMIATIDSIQLKSDETALVQTIIV